MVKKGEVLRILIITGLSGAGKTQTVNCLEDIGYYCVDNLPPALLTKFVELGVQSEGKIDKVALVMDARGGDFFHDLIRSLGELEQDSIQYEILFLEASDEVLVRRFKESRRKHPLSGRWRLLEAIQIEKTMLEELRGQANVVIDTSNTTSRELREKLISLYSEQAINGFSINIVSFGYKMGIPLDSDLVIDVRFLPNPFYDPTMKTMTGMDQEVKDFVLESAVTRSFNRRFMGLLKYLIPHYIKEGKTNLALSIGCTGGQHRSVVLAEYMAKQLKNMGYSVLVKHRDNARYKLEE
ncbi:putative p-loop-containing kinase [hydrocarbon metagenome]|uniref:Putative p-loop-containing kinase n=1 Tax=hydrocarbon metagenome TaxID=938273 RepID=A0A0W8E5H6_9ZZZZ